MAPTSDSQARLSDGRSGQPWQGSRVSDSVAQSQSRRNDESWVEVSSQPSSSSLSSIGDEIVTTGLRVGSQHPSHRRRRVAVQQQEQQAQQERASTQAGPSAHPLSHAENSSQEEYEETESEDDRLMTSSQEQEQLRPSGLPQQRGAHFLGADSDTDSEDDRATALGRPSNSPTFRPQPNAFSHPPSHLQHRHSTNSSIPYHSSYHRPSMSQRSQTRVHRRPPNFMSPAYREDNDAALRASLTTLLSCAAAARGLPKKDGPTIAGPSGTNAGVRPSNQPLDLRLVPESELMSGPPVSAKQGDQLQVPARTVSNSSAPSGPASACSRDAEKGKRPASSSATQKQQARATKKKRSSVVVDEGTTFISPTMLTWVVSAGVVVLVSVVGFGAGYVIGREVGRQEGAAALGGMGGFSSEAGVNASSCGRELVRSSSGGTLRRFRWGEMARSVAA